MTENSPDKQNNLTTEAPKWFIEILAWQVVENLLLLLNSYPHLFMSKTPITQLPNHSTTVFPVCFKHQFVARCTGFRKFLWDLIRCSLSSQDGRFSYFTVKLHDRSRNLMIFPTSPYLTICIGNTETCRSKLHSIFCFMWELADLRRSTSHKCEVT